MGKTAARWLKGCSVSIDAVPAFAPELARNGWAYPAHFTRRKFTAGAPCENSFALAVVFHKYLF